MKTKITVQSFYYLFFALIFSANLNAQQPSSLSEVSSSNFEIPIVQSECGVEDYTIEEMELMPWWGNEGFF